MTSRAEGRSHRDVTKSGRRTSFVWQMVSLPTAQRVDKCLDENPPSLCWQNGAAIRFQKINKRKEKKTKKTEIPVFHLVHHKSF